MTVAPAAAAPRDGAEASRETESTRLRPFAGLRLAGGTALVFYELGSQEGGPSGIGMASYVPVRGVDPATVEELGEANPFEIFYALSDADTHIPDTLRRNFDNRYQQRTQGWALSQISTQLFAFDYCEMSELYAASAVNASGLPNTYMFLSTGPHNSSLWDINGPNAPYATHSTEYLTNGNSFFHVVLCKEDQAFVDTGVSVDLEYKEYSKWGYALLNSGTLHWELANAGDKMSFKSFQFDSDLSGTHVWRYKLLVDDVHYYDTLHLGFAWS